MKWFGWEVQAAWRAFEQDKDYAFALELFLQHFDTYDDEDSLAKIFECCRQLGDYERGMRLIDEHVMNFRNSKIVVQQAALLEYDFHVGRHMKNRCWEEAESNLILMLESDHIPASLQRDAYLDYLRVLFKQQKWAAYIKSYNCVELQDLSNAERHLFNDGFRVALHKNVKELVCARKFEEALLIAEHAMQAFPSEMEFVRKYAQCLVELSQTSAAVDILKKKVNQRSAWVMNYELAKMLLQLGNEEDALHQAIVALEKPGRLVSKFNLLVLIYQLISKTDDAEDNEIADMLLTFLVRLRDRLMLTLPENLLGRHSQLRRELRQLDFSTLELMVRLQVPSFKNYCVKALPGIRGALDYERKTEDGYGVSAEGYEDNSIFCREEDIPADICRSSGRILFNLSFLSIPRKDGFTIQAINIVPDNLSNRAKTSVHRSPFDFFWNRF